MKIRGLSILLVLVLSIVCSPVFGAKAEAAPFQDTDRLSGFWIGTLSTKDGAPLGAALMELEQVSNRSLTGAFVPGLPALNNLDLNSIDWTVAANGNLSGVASASLMTLDERKINVQILFNGEYLIDTGAIIADGWIHLSGADPEQVFNSTDVTKNFLGAIGVDVPTFDRPVLPDFAVIDVIPIGYFGGQDMGHYFGGQDMGHYFGGQDMGHYFTSFYFEDYFGGQDMGHYFDLDYDFGGQDMGHYLTDGFITKFFGPSVNLVEVSKGGAVECVLMMVPAPTSDP